MTLEQIIPALALMAVLILILPNFLQTNSKSKVFLKNLFIWIFVTTVIIIFIYIFL